MPATSNAIAPAETAQSTLLPSWLLATATITGAAVMAEELLGARMLGTSFGGSMSVWAGMISVTLLSLAVGYFIGGWLVDRHTRPTLLGWAVFIAAALTGICPHIRGIVDLFAAHLGAMGGVLASSLVIFFLPLSLMGMTGPFVIRLLADRQAGIGITAGRVYAISTLGSVAGTLLTGLWLIPHFGVSASFHATAIVLAIISMLGLLLTHPWHALAGAVLVAVLCVLPPTGLKVGATFTAPDGDKVKVIAVEDSAYGRLAVLEKGNYRLLLANGIVQTGVPSQIREIPRTQQLIARYFQELLPYTVDDPANSNVLIIGLAGGMTASLLRQYGMAVDAVDIDPAVIRLARKYFSFIGPAEVADGRCFLAHCKTSYNFCVIDTYSGDVFPFQLCTVEAFRAARSVLKANGMLAVNFIGAPGGAAFASMYRTLHDAFPYVLAIRGEDGDDVQTITCFASRQPIQFNNGWIRYLNDYQGVDPVATMIDRLTITTIPATGQLLTDDRNPMDELRAAEALHWRVRTATFIGRQAMRY